MFMVFVNDEGTEESYAITQDETASKWLIIRKRVDSKTGHSPLVGTGDNLDEAFAEMARIIQTPVGRAS